MKYRLSALGVFLVVRVCGYEETDTNGVFRTTSAVEGLGLVLPGSVYNWDLFCVIASRTHTMLYDVQVVTNIPPIIQLKVFAIKLAVARMVVNSLLKIYIKTCV